MSVKAKAFSSFLNLTARQLGEASSMLHALTSKKLLLSFLTETAGHNL